MNFRKIRQLHEERNQKLLSLSNILGRTGENEHLKYSVISKDKQLQGMIVVKNLDNSSVSLLNQKQYQKLFEHVDSLPQASYGYLLERSWNSYLNGVEKEEEQFLEACFQGDLKYIQKVLMGKTKHPIDPARIHTIEGKNGIHLAVISQSPNYRQVIQILVKNQVNINEQTSNEKRTPLMIGIILGKIQAVKTLLELEASLTIQDFQGNTILHLACLFNQQDIVEILLEYQCSIEVKNIKKQTPIECISDTRIFQIIRADPYYGNNLIKTQDILSPNSRETHIKKLFSKLQDMKNDFIEESIISSKRNFKSRNQHRREKIKQMMEKEKENKISNFQKLSILGKGAFGEVFLAQNCLDHKKYAIKSLDKKFIVEQKILRYAMTQRKILSTIQSPFVVKLHYAFQSQDKLYLVMDYCSGGDLLRQIKKKGKLSEKIVKKYAAEIILAIQKLHQAQIIYRDLKPGNIVLDKQGHALLTDFGLSKEASLAHSFCGSTAYLAPQMLWRRGHTKVIDWYLLGVLIYQCLSGKPPFWDTNKEQLLSNIKTGRYKPLPQQYTLQVHDLVQKLLRSNHSKRLGINGAKQIKAHNWFKDVNWEDVEMRKQKMDDLEQVPGRPIKQQKFIQSQNISNKIEGWDYVRNYNDI